MKESPASVPWARWSNEDDRRNALDRCSAQLSQEGFAVSRAVGWSAKRGVRPPDLIGSRGPRVVQVLVLLHEDIDAPDTRRRIRAAFAQGETRLWVPWPFRWRVFSNLERWGVRGVSVEGW